MRDLSILHLGRTRYGVWGGDVRTRRAVETIHRLPLSPDYMAGMSIIDDRTVMLADLAACIGLPRTSQAAAGHILLGPEGERGEAEGPAPRVPPPATAFLPQPGPLAQPEAAPDSALRQEWRPEPQPIEPEQPVGAAAPSEPARVQPVA